MEKNFDVIAMGELLIDFTMNRQSEQGNNPVSYTHLFFFVNTAVPEYPFFTA